MSMPKLTVVHYLFTEKRGDRFLAHCLDFDIVVAGPTADETEDRLDALVKIYIEKALHTQNYAMLTTAAPREFWRQYQEAFAARRIRTPRRPVLTIRVPEMVLMDDQPSGEIEVLGVRAA
jgi:hypothetical protein